jgi:uncharacterized protein YdaU (DUF1376 family)
VNYYNHHIGDYAQATSHLSILEDGVYSRLLRKYYSNEQPLPANVDAIARQIGARSEPERAALQAVLQDFFTLREDGWHQERCDAEIEVFHDKLADLELAKDNAKIRQRRAREHRKSLFEELRSLGVVPAFSSSNAELADMLARTRNSAEKKDDKCLPSDLAAAAASADAHARLTRDTAALTRDDTASPNSNPQAPTTKRHKSAASRTDTDHLQPGFLEFWSVWPKSPRKEARGKCAEVWKGNDLERIASLVVAHVKAKTQAGWAEKGGAYMEAPLVYLNQRRWEGAELPQQTTTLKSAGGTRHAGLHQLNHKEGVNEDGTVD